MNENKLINLEIKNTSEHKKTKKKKKKKKKSETNPQKKIYSAQPRHTHSLTHLQKKKPQNRLLILVNLLRTVFGNRI